jgi:hypothetical protein
MIFHVALDSAAREQDIPLGHLQTPHALKVRRPMELTRPHRLAPDHADWDTSSGAALLNHASWRCKDTTSPTTKSAGD